MPVKTKSAVRWIIWDKFKQEIPDGYSMLYYSLDIAKEACKEVIDSEIGSSEDMVICEIRPVLMGEQTEFIWTEVVNW